MKPKSSLENRHNRAATVFEAPCNPSPEPSRLYAARSVRWDGDEGKTEIFLRL